MDTALLFAVFGGFLEPVWVWFLSGYDSKQGYLRYAYLALFLFFSIASVLAVGAAMGSMNMGVAYSVWTAVGSVSTVVISRVFLKESLNVRKVLGVFLVLTGIIGIELFGGVV